MIATLEALLLASLTEAHADAKVIVEPYPEQVNTYVLKSEAAVLVHYAGSDFGPPLETDIVQQVMEYAFQVVTISRNLRTHAGSYTLLDTNRAAIVGLVAEGMQFFGMSEEFITRENGVWWYRQIFSVRQLYNGSITM